eukprot:g1234.t1
MLGKLDKVGAVVYFAIGCLFCYSIGLGGHWLNGRQHFADPLHNCTVTSHQTLWKVCTTWDPPCDQDFINTCIDVPAGSNWTSIQALVVSAFLLAMLAFLVSLSAPHVTWFKLGPAVVTHVMLLWLAMGFWIVSAVGGFISICIMSSTHFPSAGQKWGSAYVFETLGWLLAIAPALLNYWEVSGGYNTLQGQDTVYDNQSLDDAVDDSISPDTI